MKRDPLVFLWRGRNILLEHGSVRVWTHHKEDHRWQLMKATLGNKAEEGFFGGERNSLIAALVPEGIYKCA